MTDEAIQASHALANATVEVKMDFSDLLNEAITRSRKTSERKQVRGRKTESQILNAALRVFAHKGVSRSRIADIAAEAGISSSSLYEYYSSKEALAYDVPMSHLCAFYTDFAVAVEGITSPCERILLLMSMWADFVRHRPEWGRLFYLEIWPSVMVGETELRHSVDDFARILTFLIRQAMSEGELPDCHDPYGTTAILLGATNQLIVTWLLYRRPRNFAKASSTILSRTLAMLKSESTLPSATGSRSTARRITRRTA